MALVSPLALAHLSQNTSQTVVDRAKAKSDIPPTLTLGDSTVQDKKPSVTITLDLLKVQ